MELVTAATAGDEGRRKAKVAVLPVGSFEQHGEYLPLITDSVVACAIAGEVSKIYPVFLLPPITIACSHEHAAWPGTVSISSETLYRIVNDIALSLKQSGIERLILINGHGGNYVLSNAVQEYNATHGTRMTLFPHSDDWQKARDAAGLQSTMHEDMHAGELETSLLMRVAPHLIRPGNDQADFIADDRRFLLTLGMSGYTKTGVIGKPSLGTEEKGKRLLDSLARSFADHLELLREAA
jgi:creatinine amidohydrolase